MTLTYINKFNLRHIFIAGPNIIVFVQIWLKSVDGRLRY